VSSKSINNMRRPLRANTDTTSERCTPIGEENTSHDTPEMNGVAERLNYTLMNLVRAMLAASGLPKTMWGFALRYATWIKNRVPTKALEKEKKTSFEMLMGTKPDLLAARGFGSKVFVKSKSESKIEPRGVVARWVGVNEETKGGHFVYWPKTRSVTVERDVRFVDGTVFVGENDNVPVVTTTTLQPTPNHLSLLRHQPSRIPTK